MRGQSYQSRFYELLSENENGCLLWIGGTIKSNGREGFLYGRLKVDGTFVLAHRHAYQLKHSNIPRGMCVLHRCDTPLCCNYNHLFLGTHADNMRDMAEKNRAAKNNGDSNGNSVLTVSDVLEIRLSEESYSTIARSFGVCKSTIHNIKTRKQWKHL